MLKAKSQFPIQAFMLLLLCSAVLQSDIIDRPSIDATLPDHQLLMELERPLADRGVDIEVRPQEAAPPKVSRLSLLSNYPVDGGTVQGDNVDREMDRWSKDFEDGKRGYLLAFRDDSGKSEVNFDAFSRSWEGAPADKRVFLSFNRADLETALAVKETLIAKNYVVFTYMNEDGNMSVQTGDRVAKFFTDAKTKLVIDSTTARKSFGVQFEAWSSRVIQQNDLYTRSIREGVDPPAGLQRIRVSDLDYLRRTKQRVHTSRIPGGVIFGRTASFEPHKIGDSWSVSYEPRFGVRLTDSMRNTFTLPAASATDLHACFLFALADIRPDADNEDRDSDSIVSIDARRDVHLARPFQNTLAGAQLIYADLAPFDYLTVNGLSSAKSVIQDRCVRVISDPIPGALAFETELEIVFFAIDNEGFIDEVASLIYTWRSGERPIFAAAKSSIDDSRLVKRTPTALSDLGHRLNYVAEHAAWLASFKMLKSNGVAGLDATYDSLRTPEYTPANVRDWTSR